MFLFRILIISSFIFCQSNFQIDKFYEHPSESPFLTFDHTNNTAYYFNLYNPSILDDGQILDIKINGSTFSPLGTYDISPLYKNIYLDSLVSNEFEHKRGDYGYYENTIVINNENNNDVSAFLLLHARTQPRYYSTATRGISLQNYIFNISKVNQTSKINMSFMYHNENIIFPISSSETISRFSDSYLFGTSFKSQLNKFYFDISYSSQFENGNYYLNNTIDEFTHWVDLESNFKYHKHSFLCADINYKKHSMEFDELDYLDQEIFNFTLYNRFYYNNLRIDLGLDNVSLNNNDFMDNLYLDISYKINSNIELSFINQNLNYMNNELKNQENDDFDEILNSYHNTLQSFIFKYKQKYISIYFEPFSLMTEPLLMDDKINGFKINANFNNNIIIADIYGAKYFATDLLSINSYINYSILIAPPIENNRFRPFVGVSGNFLSLSNINLYGPLVYTYGINEWDDINNSKIVNQLNLKFGFILNRFKITFNYMNFLNKHISFTFNNRYESLDNFFSLDINWQFLD